MGYCSFQLCQEKIKFNGPWMRNLGSVSAACSTMTWPAKSFA